MGTKGKMATFGVGAVFRFSVLRSRFAVPVVTRLVVILPRFSGHEFGCKVEPDIVGDHCEKTKEV